MLLFFFLSSGLFLGWSLGANDAANIFGTAVGSRMLKFRTAAAVGSLFVILGATLSGAGPSATLAELGSVNVIAGAFMVALAAGFTVFIMTRFQLPIATSQAIVGAIIGWNLFSGRLTNLSTLGTIVASWVFSPILAALLACGLYKLLVRLPGIMNIHLFRLDAYTRTGLIVIGAFGAYSLGANNIANVMGVFVPAAPFTNITLGGWLQISGRQQLFCLGGIAIAAGIITYSREVMHTVGRRLIHLTPQAALVVVAAEALVLFLFASRGLHDWLSSRGLPAIPLVPVSSSQAVVGAILGIGIAHGWRNIRFQILGRIAVGWVISPVFATLLTFTALFFMQNVFNQKVYEPVHYQVTAAVREKLAGEGLELPPDLPATKYENARRFRSALTRQVALPRTQLERLLALAEIHPLTITGLESFRTQTTGWFTEDQIAALERLEGTAWQHSWELTGRLREYAPQWSDEQLEYLLRYFRK